MSLEWKTVTLGSCCNFQEGYVNPSQKNPEYFNGDIKWIRAVDLNDSYVYETSRTLTREGYNSAGKSALLFKPNTIVISKSGTVGRLGIIKDYMCGNRATINIIPHNNISMKFIFYVLKYHQRHFKDMAVGSVQKNLYVSILENLEIPLPSIEVQNKIATVLSNIDDKIDCMNKINKNLFNIASSLQREWMVNFTPFKSEQFKSSSFGLIPENWNVGKLGDVIELLDSKRIPLSGQERENMEKIYPYYGAASLMDYVDDYIFDGIYLLIGEDGTVVDDKGFPILQYVWGKFWVNNHAHIVKGKNGFNVDSLYLLLTKTNIQSIVTGAVQAKVNQNNLKSIEIIIPPVEVMEKFNELIKPFFDAIRSNHDKIKKLQKLRDTLLPKLMSGEIDVSKINCDLKIIIIKFILNPLKYLWRYLNENKDYIQNTKSNETLLKSRPIYKINKFFTKFTSRYRNYRQ